MLIGVSQVDLGYITSGVSTIRQEVMCLVVVAKWKLVMRKSGKRSC